MSSRISPCALCMYDSADYPTEIVQSVLTGYIVLQNIYIIKVGRENGVNHARVQEMQLSLLH